MSKKTWIIFAIIVVAFVGGMMALSESNKINLDSIDINNINILNNEYRSVD